MSVDIFTNESKSFAGGFDKDSKVFHAITCGIRTFFGESHLACADTLMKFEDTLQDISPKVVIHEHDENLIFNPNYNIPTQTATHLKRFVRTPVNGILISPKFMVGPDDPEDARSGAGIMKANGNFRENKEIFINTDTGIEFKGVFIKKW
jgi:hypothetical protein